MERGRASRFAIGLAIAGGLLSSAAHAAPVIAPPGDPSYDAPLASLAAGYQLQQDNFAAIQFGLSLDVDVSEASVPSVVAFFAQDAAASYQAFAGKPPFAALDSFDEYEDIGNFAGIASVGVAARLMALKAAGAPASQIAAARDAAVRAAQAWHVYAAIGGDGVIARGIQRTTPLGSGTGPLPGTLPPLVPLKDGSGNPLPNPKVGVWRAPVAPGFDGWIWLDDTSKDQVSGFALAAAWLWDALVDDPMVDRSVPAALGPDLTAMAKALMKPAPEYDDIDLCIRDADGRLTDAHDLNPRQITPTGVVAATSLLQNGFNAAMALGVILAAYHVGGDPVVGQYLYDELIGARGYASMFSDAALIFTGASTNYSNVNMLAISYGLLGRFEADPKLHASYAASIESTFWSTGSADDVSHVSQAWYDVVYAGLSAHPTATLRDRVAANLGGFPTPPAFYEDRVNCSPSAIEAGVCTGLDGKTKLTLAGTVGHDGTLVANEVVPIGIRPYTDFQWRSDPHDVNGTGPTNLMEPGGDFLAAYWLGRVIDLDDPSKNLTPKPRAVYDGGAPGDASAPDASAGDGGAKHAAPASSGCGCGVPGDVTDAAPLLGGALSLAGLFAGRRRRRRTRDTT